MTIDELPVLKADLAKAEERRTLPYDDATGLTLHRGDVIVGNITIGIGRNLSERGLSATEIDFLCENDVVCAIGEIAMKPVFRKFDTWSPARQRALTELVFNIGMPRVMTFHRMLTAIAQEDWSTAAEELLDSHWHLQVGELRAQRIARYLRDG